VYELYNSKFKNTDELYDRLVNMWYDYWITYKGNKYFLSWYQEDSANIFSVGRTWLDEEASQYETFDEMLDNFKEGEKSLREFASDIEPLRHTLVTKKSSCDLTYEGNVYFLCRYPKKGKIIFVILINPDFDDWGFENWNFANKFKSGSFDELLDNFKVDGKGLKEFIFDAEIEAEQSDRVTREYITEIAYHQKKGKT
jgi:hypothetical protein